MSESIFPKTVLDTWFDANAQQVERIATTDGITKRELFAAMAMQGDITFWRDKFPDHYNARESAAGWVAAADALLTELAKERKE